MVKVRLSIFLEENVLVEHCYAHRKRKSTTTLLKISVAKSKGRVVKAVSVDISKAYERVDLLLLAETMREKNVPSDIYSWTLRFLEYRDLKLDE